MDFDKIIEQKEQFEAHEDVDIEPQTECYNLYKEFLTTGKYPYYRQVTEYVCSKLNIHDSKLEEAIYHQAYLCAHKHEKEERGKHKESMLADGWQILTYGKFVQLYELKRRIKARFVVSGDWASVSYSEIFKLFYNEKTKDCALMKPRQRSRGILINNYFPPHSEDVIFYQEI